MEKDNNGNGSGKVDLRQFKDVSGVTLGKLEFGLWLARNRHNFKIILIVILASFSAITWTYSLFNLAVYFAKGRKQDLAMFQVMTSQQIVGHDYVLANSTKDLRVLGVYNLRVASNKYDLLARIENPNKNYHGEFDYCFFSGDKKIKCDKGFLLPGDGKFIMALGQEIKGVRVDISFKIENLRWRRVDRHKISDWNSFKEDHFRIKVDDVSFVSGDDSGLSEELSLNSLRFKVVNQTPYNYRDLAFNILLYSNDQMVSAQRTSLGDFMTSDVRNIELTWPGELSNVDRTEVVPDINIMDDSIYIKNFK